MKEIISFLDIFRGFLVVDVKPKYLFVFRPQILEVDSLNKTE